MRPRRVRAYRIGNELGRPTRNGALLDDDGALSSVLGNDSGNSLKGSHIGGYPGADTSLFGGGIDGNKDNIGLGNAVGDVGGEEEIAGAARHGGLAIVDGGALRVRGGFVGEGRLAAAIAGNADNVVQARLVDGRMP